MQGPGDGEAEAAARSLYVEEEDCLGFNIWVAELELVVGTAKGKRKPDAAQCLSLLQKLVATLGEAAPAEVRTFQRRCEDALVDILLKGAPPPVSAARASVASAFASEAAAVAAVWTPTRRAERSGAARRCSCSRCRAA